MDRQSEWVIKFNGLSGDSGQQGPYSPYKLCNHSLYIGIIMPQTAITNKPEESKEKDSDRKEYKESNLE